MAISIDVQDNGDHLFCVGNFPFTFANAVECVQLVLRECLSKGRSLVLLDLTAIREDTPATVKSLTAFSTLRDMMLLNEHSGVTPRVAVLGSPPLISTYQPANEIFRANDTPVAVFTDREAARRWLFADS